MEQDSIFYYIFIRVTNTLSIVMWDYSKQGLKSKELKFMLAWWFKIRLREVRFLESYLPRWRQHVRPTGSKGENWVIEQCRSLSSPWAESWSPLSALSPHAALTGALGCGRSSWLWHSAARWGAEPAASPGWIPTIRSRPFLSLHQLWDVSWQQATAHCQQNMGHRSAERTAFLWSQPNVLWLFLICK